MNSNEQQSESLSSEKNLLQHQKPVNVFVIRFEKKIIIISSSCIYNFAIIQKEVKFRWKNNINAKFCINCLQSRHWMKISFVECAGASTIRYYIFGKKHKVSSTVEKK